MERLNFNRDPDENAYKDGIDLLRIINRDKPENAARLEEVIATEENDLWIYSRCNEIGECVYDDFPHPDAFNWRFAWQFAEDFEQPLVLPPTEETTEFHHVDDFFVNLETVLRLRKILQYATWARTERVLKPVQLETHEDYLRYFESFHPEVLQQLLKNLSAIELTEGCTAPCFDTCTVARVQSIKRKIPFEILEWLMSKHPEMLDKEEQIMFYWGTDMKYYRPRAADGTYRTAVDVLKLHDSHAPRPLAREALSTAFGVDEFYSVEFVYQLLMNDFEIWRISRLKSGLDEADLDRLIKKLEKRAEKDGKILSPEMVGLVEKAFETGSKASNNKLAGNAVTEETQERDICLHNYNCRTGVILSPSGFKATMFRPASKVFPHHDFQWPILAHPDVEIAIPKDATRYQTKLPYTYDRHKGKEYNHGARRDVLFRTRFLCMTADGQIVDDEEPHPLALKLKTLNDYEHFVHPLIPPKGQLILSNERALVSTMSEERHAFESKDELLEAAHALNVEIVEKLSLVKAILTMRLKICEQYQDDPMVLLEMAQRDFSLNSLTKDLCNVLKYSLKNLITDLERFGADGDYVWSLDEDDLKELDDLLLQGNDILEANWPQITALAEGVKGIKIYSPSIRPRFFTKQILSPSSQPSTKTADTQKPALGDSEPAVPQSAS